MRWAWPEGYARREGPGRRVVAIDYGAKRNILRCLASAGCDVTVLPATATAEEVLAHDPGGPVPVERPRRPGGDRRVRGADDPRGAGPERHAGLRHLPRAPDAGAGARRADDQDEPRPPRRQSSGEGARDRKGRDHLDEPRLHRGQPDPAAAGWSRRMSRSSTARTAASPSGDGRVFSVQHHPEASPGPQDSFYLFERFVASMERSSAGWPINRYLSITLSVLKPRRITFAGSCGLRVCHGAVVLPFSPVAAPAPRRPARSGGGWASSWSRPGRSTPGQLGGGAGAAGGSRTSGSGESSSPTA